jgi:hypothetical protein
VNFYVAISAICILGILVMLRTGRFFRPNAVCRAVARQAKLANPASDQKARIRGAMRSMASNTAFGLYRRVFVNKWPLLIGMTLNTSSVCTRSQPRLFEFKTPVRIVTVAAAHGAFEDFMMKRQVKLVLDLRMAANAQLRLTGFEEFRVLERWFLRISRGDKSD